MEDLVKAFHVLIIDNWRPAAFFAITAVLLLSLLSAFTYTLVLFWIRLPLVMAVNRVRRQIAAALTSPDDLSVVAGRVDHDLAGFETRLDDIARRNWPHERSSVVDRILFSLVDDATLARVLRVAKRELRPLQEDYYRVAARSSGSRKAAGKLFLLEKQKSFLTVEGGGAVS